MTDDMRMIREAKKEINGVLQKFCEKYPDLCTKDSGSAVLSALDGNLRICKKLCDLEDKA